jgi:hypothetical protein
MPPNASKQILFRIIGFLSVFSLERCGKTTPPD